MAYDLIKTPELWLPSKPAIIRAARVPEFDHRRIRRDQFPCPVFCPGSEVSTLVWRNNANANATTIKIPPAAAGDIAVLFDSANNASGTIPSLVVPSGWTQIRTDTVSSTSSGRCTLSYKVLTSGDLGATITGQTGSGGSRKILGVFRPDVPLREVTISGDQGQGTSGDPTLQTITPGTSPLILFGHARGSGTIAGTLTSSGSKLPGSSSDHYAYYNIQNTTTASRTFDIGPSGPVNILQSFCMAVR